MSSTPETFAIKVRRPKAKQWQFLGRDGRTSWLRIHATPFRSSAAAEDEVALNAPLNPGVEWKVVPFDYG
jgi:hypothetical protein